MWAAALCGGMALVWAARARKRGWPAVPMTAAFVVFGCVMLLLRARAPQWSVVALAVLLFLLLVLDAFLRTVKGGAK